MWDLLYVSQNTMSNFKETVTDGFSRLWEEVRSADEAACAHQFPWLMWCPAACAHQSSYQMSLERNLYVLGTLFRILVVCWAVSQLSHVVGMSVSSSRHASQRLSTLHRPPGC